MKQLLENFTEAEIQYICYCITPKRIRIYFQKKPKEFHAIHSGFRAEALSDDDTVSCVYKNIRKQFIASFIEKNISQWLQEIRDFRNELEEQGILPDEALLRTLPQSVFSENIDLYFKCTDEIYSEDYISLLKTALQYAEQEKNKDVSEDVLKNNAEDYEQKEELVTLRDRITELSNTISELQKKLDSNKDIHAKTVESLDKVTAEKKQLQNDLTAVNEQMHAAHSKLSAMAGELEHFYQLAKFSDVEDLSAHSGEYKFTSVCQVRINSLGKPRLTRIADIKDGEIVRFIQNEDAPRYFENRDWLFWVDGPSDEGYIGVWNWNVGPNMKDPATDYVTIKYNEYISITEIMELSTCHCVDDIACYITDNAIEKFSGMKMFFAFQDTDHELNGLLCNEQDFEVVNDKLKLKKSVYMLPQFSIPVTDVFTVGEKKLYKYTSLGLPQNVYQIKDPIVVVKELILARATNTALRQLGLSNKEVKLYRNFLKTLPVNSLYQEISDAYDCSEAEAEKYVSDFISQAESYLSEEDIETSVLSKALERNAELVMQCKNMLTVEWEKDYSEKLQNAEQQMKEISAAIVDQKEELERSKINYKELQDKLQLIQAEIEAKKMLACEVEDKVTERIALARKNVADFICDMAFALPEHTVAQQAEQKLFLPTVTHRRINSISEEDISDLDTFEEELAENLELSGYKELVAAEMAQTIVFCISNRLPLIINENADRIADCISAMFSNEGAYAVTFPIGESNCSRICSLIGSEAVKEHNVFIVNGIFDGFSLNPYSELLQQSAEWTNNVILILPLNGTPIEMIPSSVWSRAMFIDGDIGVEGFPTSDLHVFTSKVIFETELDTENLRNKRKLLKPFASIISNTALLNYSKFLAVTNRTIESSMMLWLQIAVYAKTTGKAEELTEVFSAMGIDTKENRDLSKYM